MNYALPTGINIGLECSQIFDESAQQSLRDHGRPVKLKRNQVLFSEGETCEVFYLLTKGLLKLSHSDRERNTTIVEFVEPGSAVAVGLMEAKSNIYPLTATALEACELIRFSRDKYREIWKLNSQLNAFCVDQIRTHMMNVQADRTLQCHPLEKRIAYLFTHRLKKRAIYPLTRKDVAQWSGTSIESVIRVLSHWTKLGWIDTKNSEIQLLQEHKIEERWRA